MPQDRPTAAPTVIQPSLVERRTECRHVPVEPCCLVGWWDGDAFEVARAALENLSRGGAMLQVSDAPVGLDLWFCLDVDRWLGSVQARVRAVARPAIGGYSVRIQFPDPVPEGLFRAACEGLGAVVPEEFPADPAYEGAIALEPLPDVVDGRGWVAVRCNAPSVN